MGCICMKKRGIGMASIFYGTGYGNGFPDVATAVVEVHDDGSATVLTGAADCGQGSNTTLAQIAAAELGIELHKVTLISADTDCTPDTGTTAATRQTYSSGNAVRLAVAKAKQKILQHAAKILKVNTIDGLILQDNHVYVKTYPKVNLPLEQVVSWQHVLLGREWWQRRALLLIVRLLTLRQAKGRLILLTRLAHKLQKLKWIQKQARSMC